MREVCVLEVIPKYSFKGRTYMYLGATDTREIIAKRATYLSTMDNIVRKAEVEKRSLTIDEMRDFDNLDYKVKAIDAQLAANKPPVCASLGMTLGTAPEGGGTGRVRMISPGEKRDYASMFPGQTGTDEWKSFSEFVQAVASRQVHPQLRAISEGIPSDGGFVVPPAFAQAIYDVALEGEVVRPRATVYPMQSDSLTIPASTIGDHSANLFGGTTAAWGPEGGTLAESQPKFRAMALIAKKLSIYTVTTSEWAEDALNPDVYLRGVFASALGWYLDLAFLRGDGSGRPLGVLKSPCLVVTPKELGQAKSSVTYGNLTAMLGRLAPESFSRSVWVCHQTLIPQLLALSAAIGTGGAYIPALSQAGGQFTLLTRPVVFTEKTEPLGSQGDILLADFSAYAIGMRSGLRLERSIGPLFQQDKISWRAITRCDGQPLWDKALTLADGITQVSPFVTLAERA